MHGLPQELIRTMGRLKFRYSYGQNQLTHSLEVSFLAAMAAELGADVNICRRGLPARHRQGRGPRGGRPHAIIGADLARKFNPAAGGARHPGPPLRG